MRDFAAPRRELETDSEDALVEWAEANGWVARKTRYLGRHGCADRHYYGHGTVVIVEHKRPDGERRPGQVREARRLAAVGVTMHFVETVEEGVALLRRHMR